MRAELKYYRELYLIVPVYSRLYFQPNLPSPPAKKPKKTKKQKNKKTKEEEEERTWSHDD